MSDILDTQNNCYIHHKKFTWRSNRTVSSQDNMTPTVDSNITSNINKCLNTTVASNLAPVSNPPSDRPLSVETQSVMPLQPIADVPLDFSVKNSNNIEQPQNMSDESSFSKTQKVLYGSEKCSPDKSLDKDMHNGNSSPVHTKVKSEISSPNQSSTNGFSAASHNFDIRLRNSHAHLQNGKGIYSAPNAYFAAENAQRTNAFQYQPINMQKMYTEHPQQLKISTENGKEINRVNLHEEDPSRSPTPSSSLSLESSPPNRYSSSILEEALAGKQGERSHVHGIYPNSQNYNFHESNTKPLQLTPSPKSNMSLCTKSPRTGTEANRTFPREAGLLPSTNAAVPVGFPSSVSPLGLTNVNHMMPGINPLIPMANTLISPANFPLHNALASETMNGMNPFLMSPLNSRLPHMSSGGDRKTGKPLRPFKALASELLLGMARVPMSHALYPGYNVTGFTNGTLDPHSSNSAPKKEVPRESEKCTENNTSNEEQTVVGASNSNDSNGFHNEMNGCDMEPADSSNSLNRKRSRLPEDQKDDAYWERRRKNNEAAKRSRDARRIKEDMITHTACALSQENVKLSINLQRMQDDNGNLLLQIKSLVEDKQRMDIQMQILKSELISRKCWNCGLRYSDGHDKKVGLD